MSEPAFTPGPWHVMEDGFSRKNPSPTVYAADDHLRYIAKCGDFGSGTDNLANARLIAAAPALYIACQKAATVLRVFREADLGSSLQAEEQIAAALALANGEPKDE